MKNISILGSTGSIGTQALDVITSLSTDSTETYKVVGLAANTNIELLEKQSRTFSPEAVAVYDAAAAKVLTARLSDTPIRVYEGMQGLKTIAALDNADTVLNALVGSIGMLPTLAAIDADKDIALANKETLVSAGNVVMARAKDKGVSILPVDSEHSAIFQCLSGNGKNASENPIEKIFLTASGGAFRGMNAAETRYKTAEDALRHPIWSMGKKITIDCATMMNKGFEVIEAKWLFDLEPSQIEVLVHPQSIIHSMVSYQDGSIIAQLGLPDMRLPIAYALTYPKRMKSDWTRVDFQTLNALTFDKPDYESFPCLGLAYEALRIGGTAPAIVNAANEEAVTAFIEGRIYFYQIPALIESALSSYNVISNPDIGDILAADEAARRMTIENISEVLACQ